MLPRQRHTDTGAAGAGKREEANGRAVRSDDQSADKPNRVAAHKNGREAHHHRSQHQAGATWATAEAAHGARRRGASPPRSADGG